MRNILKILAISIFLALVTGFYFKFNDEVILGDKIIGVSVLVSAFVLLPLFLYHSWKGKRLEDYTLTNKNIKKMKEKNDKNDRE